ncbi:lactococcin 972 family bacteriocin [Bacillus sp. Hm123]|uniref:lactococcin 972 family bacteriocin n=1 Tax=Bacillus sp. Hm123 TaxID=3450745 RepID=UPI003F431FFB
MIEMRLVLRGFQVIYDNNIKSNKDVVAKSTFTRKVTTGPYAGGYWIRGKDGSLLVSKFKHYKKQGRASVVNGKGRYDSGKWKPKNQFSRAKQIWTLTGTNKAYYDSK